MENIVVELARQFTAQMTDQEKREMIGQLRRFIDEEFFNLAVEGGEQPARDVPCPRCGCDRVVKRGLDSQGNQRYLCHGCGRTFTTKTKKVFSTTKLDKSTWIAFAQCHVDMLPLRESAQRCGVSLKTAFFMRHRILEAISQNMPAFRSSCGDGMELDECYIRESFKGNRSRCGYSIPRRARKGHASDNREQICVLTGVNDAGDMFFEMTGRGNMTYEQAIRCLSDKVASGTIVATDKAHAYRQALKELDVRKHLAYPSGEHKINKVNSLHSRLKEFLQCFHGVSTRRLWNYLAWFKWIWSFKAGRAADQVAELIVKQVSGCPYLRSWREYKTTPYPFSEYWVLQSKWDARARAALPMFTGRVSTVG